MEEDHEEAVSASMAFDKNRLVAIHNKAKLRFEGYFASNLYKTTCTFGSFPQSSAPPVLGLRSITLSQLVLDTIHRKRVLYGTLCVEPFTVNSIATVLEDLEGKGCRLSICGVDSSEMPKRFPKGLKVAIKEPFFKVACDLSYTLRVDTPANIVALDEFPRQDPNQFKAEGNRLFQAKKWRAAIDEYALCLLACERDPSEHKEIMVVTLSNRAEAFIRMGEYGKAVEDASKALELDPSHLKSMYRKARALGEMKQTAKACQLLEAAIQQYPGEQELVATLDRIKLI